MPSTTTMTPCDPIKPTLVPLIDDPGFPLSPLDIALFKRPCSAASVSSSETLCDPQYTPAVSLVLNENGHGIVKQTICDAPPFFASLPQKGCSTSECGVCPFEKNTDHVPEKDPWAQLSLGLTPVSGDDSEAFMDVPLSPLTISEVTLDSSPGSVMNHHLNFSPYHYGSNIPSSQPEHRQTNVYSDEADEYNVAYNTQAREDLSCPSPYDRGANDADSAPAFNGFAPRPHPAPVGEPPSFLQSNSNLLGTMNTHRPIWIRRLERRVGKGNASGSASTTSVPPSPLGLRLRVPHIDERSPTQRSALSRASEFTLLRTPSRPPPNSSQRRSLEDVLGDDYRSSKMSSRRVAFDLDERRSIISSPSLRTPPPPHPRYIELPPEDLVYVPEYPECVPACEVDQKCPQFLYKFLPSSGVEGWQWSNMVSESNVSTDVTTETSVTTDEEFDTTLFDLLSYIRECSAVTFDIQRFISSRRPLNYDISVLCTTISKVLSKIGLVLQETGDFVNDLPDAECVSSWLNSFSVVVLSLQRNLVSYRRLASLLTRRPSKDRNIDTALAKLSQYESKFRDLLSRFNKLHSVTEILVLRSELEASYRVSEENSREARAVSEVQLLERQRQRRYRHEIREEIRLRKWRL